MRGFRALLLPLVLFAGCTAKPQRTNDYPESRRVDHVDVYHGERVADPYRWLEDLDSDETKAWVDSQNELTFGYLGKIQARNRIRKRVTKLWDYERYGMPVGRGGRYFLTRNDGLQNQSVWYTMKSLQDEPKMLLDPRSVDAPE